MPPTQAQVAAQFARLHISQHDFEEAEEYLDEMSRHDSEAARRALLSASVIAYARPFTQNDPSSEDRATSHVPTRLLRDLSAEERMLHSRLLELRNKAVAHSSYASRPIQQVTVMETGFSVTGTYFDLTAEGLDQAMFKLICQKLRVACRLQKHGLSRTLPLGNSAA